MAKKEDKPKQSTYLKYSSLGFQMALTIGLGAWLGAYLDKKYNTEKPYYTIAIVLVSIFISMYQVIKDVITSNKNNDTDNNNSKSTLDEK